MTKARSFRLTGSNELKLKELKEGLKLDNENMTLNIIIERWHEVLRLGPIIRDLKYLFEDIKDVDLDEIRTSGKK